MYFVQDCNRTLWRVGHSVTTFVLFNNNTSLRWITYLKERFAIFRSTDRYSCRTKDQNRQLPILMSLRKTEKFIMLFNDYINVLSHKWIRSMTYKMRITRIGAFSMVAPVKLYPITLYLQLQYSLRRFSNIILIGSARQKLP